jgi:hypothetical protein
VNANFLSQPDSMHVLEGLMLYLLVWGDLSETRWCAVKYASRRMLRSVLVRADPNVK